MLKSQRKIPHATDIHVGSRIRMQRRFKAMSQTALAEMLGISFQQVQKYEKGANRVGSSRLQAIANLLSVPVSFFFEDGQVVSAGADGAGLKASDLTIQFLSSDEGQALNRAFRKVKDGNVRKKIVELVKTLASEA